jgi:cathepsin L
MRYKIYLENRHKIAKHNTRYHKKELPYKLELNKYADMLHSEFVRTLNGFNRTRDSENSVYKGFGAGQKHIEEAVSVSFFFTSFL